MSSGKLPFGRYREDGSVENVLVTNQNFNCSGAVTSSSQLSGHRTGSIRGCVDVVTPGYKKIVSSGGIVNNPFFKVKYTFDGGGTGIGYRTNPCTDPNGNSGTDWNSSQRTYDTGFRFQESRANGQLICPPTTVDAASLVRAAATKALAAVDTSPAEGLVTLAELGKTISMLRNPLSAINKFTERWAKSKSMRRALQQTALHGPRAIADQYLAYYYGMRPLVKDVEALLEAYVNSGEQPKRRTARGYAEATKTTVTTGGSTEASVSVGRSWSTNQYTRTDTVQVRYGILYVPSSQSFAKSFGLRFSDLPSAVLELTPWSFLVNYFANVKDVIGALSPRPGVEYLAAWCTVKTRIHMTAAVLASGVRGPSMTYMSRPGSEYASVIIEATERTPTNAYLDAGLAFKFDVQNWPAMKQIAVLCLAIQQTHAYLAPQIQQALDTYNARNPAPRLRRSTRSQTIRFRPRA